MEHTMKLYKSDFNDLKSGKKKREYRLNDEKRKLVRIGDTIRFLKLPNLDEEFVVDAKIYKLLIIGMIATQSIMMKILKICMIVLMQLSKILIMEDITPKKNQKQMVALYLPSKSIEIFIDGEAVYNSKMSLSNSVLSIQSD